MRNTKKLLTKKINTKLLKNIIIELSKIYKIKKKDIKLYLFPLYPNIEIISIRTEDPPLLHEREFGLLFFDYNYHNNRAIFLTRYSIDKKKEEKIKLLEEKYKDYFTYIEPHGPEENKILRDDIINKMEKTINNNEFLKLQQINYYRELWFNSLYIELKDGLWILIILNPILLEKLKIYGINTPIITNNDLYKNDPLLNELVKKYKVTYKYINKRLIHDVIIEFELIQITIEEYISSIYSL